MRTKSVILLMAMLIGLLSANAQSNNPFVGVWNPVDKVWHVKAMKISEVGNGKLLVQLKTDEGIKSQEIKAPASSDEIIILKIADEEEGPNGVRYGEWRIGSWNGERGHILQYHGDGTYGTNGPATEIYSDNTANVCYCYWGYKIWLKDGNLKLEHKCWTEYYSSSQKSFMQSSGWTYSGTYTNW